jgi:hypothetical protein
VARIRLALDGGAAAIMQEVGWGLEKKLQHERLRPGDRSTQPSALSIQP